MGKETRLELCSLCKTYGTVEALKDFSLTCTPGIYGLLGPNGAGKSTLMNILAGILKPTSGEVRLNGIPMEQLGESYRSKLGFVPQQQKIYSFYTGYQFLAYMAELKGIDRKAAPAIIRKALADVELTEHADKKVGAYSGGMKQRLLLAQALLNNPEILILDEPTAGLDPRQRIVLRNLVARVSVNKIVFFATHVVSDLEMIATGVFVMREGQLVAEGTVGELTRMVSRRVGEFSVAPERLPELEEHGILVSMVNTGEDIQVRMLFPEGTEIPEGNRRKPTLEDVYLHFFPKGG